MPLLSLFAITLSAAPPMSAHSEATRLASELAMPTPACPHAWCWQVTPTTCVVNQQGEHCRLELSLVWQSQELQNVCVYLDQQQLSCWSNQQQGQLQATLPLQGPALLQLRNHQSQVLLSQHLYVLSRQPERRRRLVAPWSVF